VTSRERVAAVLHGEAPDHPPVFHRQLDEMEDGSASDARNLSEAMAAYDRTRQELGDVALFANFGTQDGLMDLFTPLGLIETAGPGCLVGPSTEIHNEIPLDNVKVDIDTARGYCY
jgi:hypothetical protein